jgi:hypothetical protein
MKRLALAAVVLAMLVGSAWAGFDEAEAAYFRGDYATALKGLLPLAEQGDSDAQNILGSMYNNGQGVPQDYAEAAKWYRKAAEQGETMAQLMLGFKYENGEGVPQDFALAHMWYNLAAAGGVKMGVVLRDMLAEDRMTPDQIAKAQAMARRWLEKHGK